MLILNQNSNMQHKFFNISETEDTFVIEVHGTIGESWWGDGVTLESVSAQLKTIAGTDKKVLVKINSYGGDVNDALAIFELLRSMGDRVTTECTGFCASAATIIAMAGAKRRMSAYGLFLIHKCSSMWAGNENDLEAHLEELRKVDERMVQLYVDVTGCEKSRIEALMEENNGNGIWLNVDEAIEYGFITEEMADGKTTEAKKKTFLNMFRLFNKNTVPMKKKISSLALLCAVLAMTELDAKDDKVLLDDDQLAKINDKLKDQEDKIASAEQAKKEADNKAAALQNKVDELQAKVDEQKALLDKVPGNLTNVLGNDTQADNDSFQQSWENSEEFKETLAKM